MKKIAIFVEGQTELIFVREFLLKYFAYQDIWVECFTLFKDSEHKPTKYPYGNKDAKYYFQINNVGNDTRVSSIIQKREKYLWNQGFDRVIGLRDMYSKEYKNIVKNHTIDVQVNQQFIDGHNNQIKSSARSQDISIIFATMEIEAWFLGMKNIFYKTDNRLTVAYIHQELKYNLTEIDPETNFFHPTDNMNEIFSLVELKYTKSEDDINAIMSCIDENDFVELFYGNKCNSFKKFFNSLGI